LTLFKNGSAEINLKLKIIIINFIYSLLFIIY